jgi:signal transduction histidine kinase
MFTSLSRTLPRASVQAGVIAGCLLGGERWIVDQRCDRSVAACDAGDTARMRVAWKLQRRTVNVDVTASDVVEGLAATSLMLLENTRLVEELRASRSRIVEAGESERRRLERDLHDGAQQRLVAIQVRVDLARELTDSEDAAKQLDAIEDDAVAALEELRELAHGIYPGVLHEHGPAAALSSLARSSPVPIRVTHGGIGRSSDAVEAAIYFCAREAIQNTAKHAGSGAKVTVALARRGNTIQFTVTDNGAGMPPETDTTGIGITGMRDRIEAVGGRFEIVSAPGQGTSVHGTIPEVER